MKSNLQISDLFEKGETFLVYPIKVVWAFSQEDQESPVRIAFSVSRRNFKKAVSRNRIKRKMKEAYRLNKHIINSLLTEQKIRCIMIFIAREDLPYDVIAKGIRSALVRLRPA